MSLSKINVVFPQINFSLPDIKTLLPVTKPEIRSYFPESWLWEVHHVPRRYYTSLTFLLKMWENANIMAKSLETTHFPIVYLRIKMIIPLDHILCFTFFFNVCFALVIGPRTELTLTEEFYSIYLILFHFSKHLLSTTIYCTLY